MQRRAGLHLFHAGPPDIRGDVVALYQNLIFKPNWNCRDVFAWLVTCPNVCAVTEVFGLPNRGVLNRLKHSARNWMFNGSRLGSGTAKFFTITASTFCNPSLRTSGKRGPVV